MKIQVLGSGCPTCKKLFEMTKEAAQQLNISDEVAITGMVFWYFFSGHCDNGLCV